MTHETVGLEILSEASCFALAATARVGRIVFTDRALPAIWPVTFTIDGDSLILCAPAGSKLAATVNNTVVAFETDHFATESRTGWSVTFLGLAEPITEPAVLSRLHAGGLVPLGQLGEPRYIRILCAQATGRRIRAVNGAGGGQAAMPLSGS